MQTTLNEYRFPPHSGRDAESPDSRLITLALKQSYSCKGDNHAVVVLGDRFCAGGGFDGSDTGTKDVGLVLAENAAGHAVEKDVSAVAGSFDRTTDGSGHRMTSPFVRSTIAD
ncbi:hypothetical protein PDO_3335 [Rhizobium sp. PDO1-076]|uniref:hypothetical protein n=1 Tax=Rhizobium sp. PDO1-076 TaxID=1125979 RepID=UPI00024E27FD|nr:hypothetical protein [Rhizobium sp. PDO1-076]EHS49313.1 hypothetical protein PDO_3335 [Rhizobium sp. PDO1-076]